MSRLGLGLVSSVLLLSVVVSSACSNIADDCQTTSTCAPVAGATAGGTTLGGQSGKSGGGNTSAGSVNAGEGGSATAGTATAGSSGNAMAGEAGGGVGGGVTLPCDGACTAPTPVCDEPNDTCVECLAEADCTASAKKKCDTDAKACVACLESADCSTAAAAKCDGGECVKCTTNNDCAHVAGKGVCDVAAGECVQCTGKDYASCGMDTGTPLVCDSVARTCTKKKKASVGLCQACVSDAQCTPGKLCVEEKFGAQPQSVGFFCFYKQGDTANGAPADCFADGAPYAKTLINQLSVDGTTADICGLRSSTCAARNQFSAKDCATGNAPDDAKCGFAAGKDSKCDQVGASANYRCTMTCVSSEDCPGVACDTGVTPAVCGL